MGLLGKITHFLLVMPQNDLAGSVAFPTQILKPGGREVKVLPELCAATPAWPVILVSRCLGIRHTSSQTASESVWEAIHSGGRKPLVPAILGSWAFFSFIPSIISSSRFVETVISKADRVLTLVEATIL